MKLQLALNETDLSKAESQVRRVQDDIDLISLSPSMLKAHGEPGIQYFRSRFPDKEILAVLDDRSDPENACLKCLSVGASYIVLSIHAGAEIIRTCIEEITAHDGKTILNVAGETADLEDYRELEAYGADYYLIENPVTYSSDNTTDALLNLDGTSIDDQVLIVSAAELPIVPILNNPEMFEALLTSFEDSTSMS